MATDKLIVSFEKAAHDAFREMAQAIMDKHGLCVRGVRLSWIDVSGPDGLRMIVSEVEVETMTRG